MSKVEALLERLALPVCEKHGVYIYDTEYKKEGSSYYLRLFIDKDGGVTINDCENVSRDMSVLLDEHDSIIKDAYLFEVSSPGVDRVLSKDWHFEKVLGQDIDIKLFSAIEGTKELSGKLVSYEGNNITVLYGEKEITIDKNKAASVRLAFKF